MLNNTAFPLGGSSPFEIQSKKLKLEKPTKQNQNETEKSLTASERQSHQQQFSKGVRRRILEKRNKRSLHLCQVQLKSLLPQMNQNYDAEHSFDREEDCILEEEEDCVLEEEKDCVLEQKEDCGLEQKKGYGLEKYSGSIVQRNRVYSCEGNVSESEEEEDEGQGEEENGPSTSFQEKDLQEEHFFDRLHYLSCKTSFEHMFHLVISQDETLQKHAANYEPNWKHRHNQQQFPKDMLCEIIQYFTIGQLYNFMRACKYFYSVGRETHSLIFKSCDISERQFQCLMHNFHKVRSLYIIDCESISPETVAWAVTTFKRIEFLRLEMNHFFNMFFDLTLNAICMPVMVNLKRLHISDLTDATFTFLSGLPNLTSLTVSPSTRTRNSSAWEEPLCFFLSNCFLEELHFALPLKAMSIPSRPNASLKALFLGWVDPNALSKLDHFLSGNAKVYTLQTSQIHPSNLTRFLKRFGPFLEDLDIGIAPQITDECCKTIASLCPNLRKIFLPFSISDFGVQYLVPCQKLSHVGVSQLNKKITPASLFFIAEEFPNIQSIELKSLRLSNLSPTVHLVKSAFQKIQLTLNIK